ncbi:MAG TPA: hypothetical protein VLM75_01720 [Spirochaetota bacterium]|nr:hypothetical protein [Spirochaetota bacterium]
MYTFKRRYLTTLFILALFATAFFITGCAGGDMATVTINIGNHVAKVDRPSIVDRILAFLTFSTRLQADPPSVFFNRIDLTVSGAGMRTIDRTIPTDTGEITLDMPSGPARVFTIVGYDDADSRLMGGIATKDLAAGENVTIPIQMGELPYPPNNTYAISGPGVNISWSYSTGEPIGLIGFIIYRSSQPGGPFIPIAAGRKEDFDNVGYRFIDPTGRGGSEEPNPTYYKIAATNPYGEGQSTYEFYANC